MKNKRLEEIQNILFLNKMGVAGINPNGNIVDRRLYPNAVAVRENELLGVARPSVLHKCNECNEIEREQDLLWNTDISMSICAKCGSENLEELPIF